MPAEGRGSPRVGSRPGAAWPRILPLALFLLATAGVVLLHDDYGVTRDEGNQAEYGEQALEYFTTAVNGHSGPGTADIMSQTLPHLNR